MIEQTFKKARNNSRKFPGERGPRPDLAEARRELATRLLAAVSRDMTPEARLATLDLRFGVDQGAGRERARIARQLETERAARRDKRVRA